MIVLLIEFSKGRDDVSSLLFIHGSLAGGPYHQNTHAQVLIFGLFKVSRVSEGMR